ncbi:MAG: hypothetical protein EA424_04040 [Planctomycetaceae bacterium]|nr:MAG: hypothetical protein EA424_04040 [Planctomycetaceae bacterium]
MIIEPNTPAVNGNQPAIQREIGGRSRTELAYRCDQPSITAHDPHDYRVSVGTKTEKNKTPAMGIR